MELQEAKLVLESVASHGKVGCGIITLANQTNIEQSKLRDFLSSNKDFFCQLNGKSKYTINRFGKYKGSLNDMHAELNKRYKSECIQSEFIPHAYFLIAIPAFFFGYLYGSS